MKYYLIAGEASGDIHASRLMAAIKAEDAEAQFRCIGGDMMAAQGAELVMHYRDLAYMGFLPVLLHLRTILKGMRRCQEDILEWRPDMVVLIDYPSFNLKIARFLKRHSDSLVCYYIAPKIWAWKEYRIKDIKQNIDALYGILPFEEAFYEKHHYPMLYVGNPTVDEVDAYLKEHPADADAFRKDNGLDARPVIALLAGSRKQEVHSNLRHMVKAAKPYAKDYQLVLAAAPGLDDDFYKKQTAELDIRIVRDQTFRLLQHSTAALVTSGTATLETALLQVPQVVCYHTKAGCLVSLLRRLVLKVPYISLVNLVAGEEVVPELVARQMTSANVCRHLATILPGGSARERQLQGYRRMAERLGGPGAPKRAAKEMMTLFERDYTPYRKTQNIK